MSELFIDMRKENEWIRKHFDADYVSVEAVLNLIEDLDAEIDHLREEVEEVKKSDNEKYEEWLSERADLLNDEKWIEEE